MTKCDKVLVEHKNQNEEHSYAFEVSILLLVKQIKEKDIPLCQGKNRINKDDT